MAVVQPNTGNIVQPKSDFELLDGGNRLVFHAKSQSKGRMFGGFLIMIPIMLVGVLAFFGGLLAMSDAKSQGGGIVAILVSIGCAFVIYKLAKWGESSSTKPVTIDAQSITFDGNTYLLDHVISIGYRASGGYSAGGTGMQGAMNIAGAQMAHALSGQVYMQYGADEIVIIRNVHPNQVQGVYNRIVGFLAQFGREYRSSP